MSIIEMMRVAQQGPPEPWYLTPEGQNTIKTVVGAILTGLIFAWNALKKFSPPLPPPAAAPTSDAPTPAPTPMTQLAEDTQGATLLKTQNTIVTMAHVLDQMQAQMQAQLIENATIRAERDHEKERADTAEARADTAEARADTAEGALRVANDRIGELEKDVADLKGRIDELERLLHDEDDHE